MPGAAHADADADVGLPVRAGEQPAVAGVDPPRRRLQQDQQRQRDLAGDIGADREPPQRRPGVQHPGQPGDRAQRPVGADDHVPGQALAVAGQHRAHRPVRVPLHGGDPGPHAGRPGRERGLAQRVVERRPGDHDPVSRVAAPGEGRQPAPPPGGADREQVGTLARVRHGHPQVGKHLHAPRPDQVAAGLVPGEGRLVGQGDPGTAAGQHQGGDAARWPGADHHGVVAWPAHRASTMASATALVAQTK